MAANEHKCRMVHISTDQLFDGRNSMYTEESFANPMNVYGMTKLFAEHIVSEKSNKAIIVRTNFFGWSPAGHPPTFGEWVYNSLKDKKPINLFYDYFFTPIEITYFIEALETVINSGFFYGIINIAGDTRCSKYDFGMEMAKTCDFDSYPITPTSMKNAPFVAVRPEELSLSTSKYRRIFKKELPTLRQSIERFCKNKPEGKF
jgi:dTDP-4-dehydrorhamnose reductase